MKKLLSIIILICISLSIVSTDAEPNHDEFFPLLTVVFEIEQVEDTYIITCVDKSQNYWSFYDDSGKWQKGDIANLLMHYIDEDYTKNEIVSAYWEGHFGN